MFTGENVPEIYISGGCRGHLSSTRPNVNQPASTTCILRKPSTFDLFSIPLLSCIAFERETSNRHQHENNTRKIAHHSKSNVRAQPGSSHLIPDVAKSPQDSKTTKIENHQVNPTNNIAHHCKHELTLDHSTRNHTTSVHKPQNPDRLPNPKTEGSTKTDDRPQLYRTVQ